MYIWVAMQAIHYYVPAYDDDKMHTIPLSLHIKLINKKFAVIGGARPYVFLNLNANSTACLLLVLFHFVLREEKSARVKCDASFSGNRKTLLV